MSLHATPALLIICAILFQASTNISLATLFSEGTRLDLSGFVVILATGFFISVAHGKRVKSSKNMLFLLALFFIYFALSVGLNGGYSVIAWTLSKYGIVTWCLVGYFLHFALNLFHISSRGQPEQARRILRLLIWVPVCLIAYLIFDLRDYLAAPYRIDSYQFAAANLTVLILMGLVVYFHAKAGLKDAGYTQKHDLPLLVFFGASTYAVYLVSRMDSTGIILTWVAMALVVWRQFFKFGLTFFVVPILFLAASYLSLAALEETEFFTETRFREVVNEGTLAISSVTNRLDLLDAFFTQFAVNPLLGHMRAEVIAGYQQGDYVHSVPLSLLTHVGLLGFALFTIIIRQALKNSSTATAGDVASRPSISLLLPLFLGIGTAVTFFTWIPLWFLLGYHVLPSVVRR